MCVRQGQADGRRRHPVSDILCGGCAPYPYFVPGTDAKRGPSIFGRSSPLRGRELSQSQTSGLLRLPRRSCGSLRGCLTGPKFPRGGTVSGRMVLSLCLGGEILTARDRIKPCLMTVSVMETMCIDDSQNTEIAWIFCDGFSVSACDKATPAGEEAPSAGGRIGECWRKLAGAASSFRQHGLTKWGFNGGVNRRVGMRMSVRPGCFR